MLAKSLKTQILKSLLGQQSGGVYFASTSYLGLLTAEPTDDGTTVHFVEPPATVEGVSSGYERVLLGSANYSITYKMTVENCAATNKDVIYFGECLEHDDVPNYPEHPWGTCSYFGIFTTASGETSGDKLIAWGLLLDKDGEPSPITPVKNQIPVIRKEQLDITIDDGLNAQLDPINH